MSVTVTCGITTAEKRQLNKSMSTSVSATGSLRNESSVVNPVILLHASAETIAGCNYMQISDFGRKYFITDIVAVTKDLCEVHGHCDVLATYASDIKKNYAIVGRSSSSYLQNRNIVDPLQKVNNKKTVIVKKIGSFPKPSGSGTEGLASSLILITTG